MIPPKKCTYKCIFDPLSLQECYVLKELNEKELDCFLNIKTKIQFIGQKQLIAIIAQRIVMVSITLNSG